MDTWDPKGTFHNHTAQDNELGSEFLASGFRGEKYLVFLQQILNFCLMDGEIPFPLLKFFGEGQPQGEAQWSLSALPYSVLTDSHTDISPVLCVRHTPSESRTTMLIY